MRAQANSCSRVQLVLFQLLLLAALQFHGCTSQSVVITPSDTQVLQFEDEITLSCSLQPDEVNVSYSWFNVDDPDFEDNNQTLNISYDFPSDTMDGGGYFCNATRQSGRTLMSDLIYIFFEPSFYSEPSPSPSPESILATIGDANLTLTCNATGFPAPNITWVRLPSNDLNESMILDLYDSDAPETIDDDSMISFSTDSDTDSSSILTFDSIEYNDFGHYACIAMQSNDSLMGEMETLVASNISTVTVSPRGGVVVITPSNPLIVSRNENASFNCTAQGGPNNTIVWIKGENNSSLSFRPPPINVLRTLELFTVIESGPILTFTSVNGSNGGIYTCVVLNEAGIESDAVELRVRPEILTNPSNIYTQDGEGDVSFECLADSFPSPQYRWERFNETLNEFYPISNESERFLMFNEVEYEDNGRYRCVATAPTINGSAISDEAVLTVSPEGSVEIDPAFTIATNGSTVTFTCSARGGPNNTFVWTRSNATGSMANETELMSLAAMIPIDVDGFLDLAGPLIIENGTELTLEYINATMDGSNYSCVVINEAGFVAVETTLYVAPIITLHPQDRLVTQGEYFTLSCLADAFPSPTYQWERMNRTSGNFEEISGEISSDLRFNNVDFDEFGMYRCVASSEGITETAVSRGALVTVSPYGSLNAMPDTQIVSRNSSPTFTCEASGGPNTTLAWIRGNEDNIESTQTPIDIDSFFDFLDVIVSETAPSLELSLENVNGTDGGNYTCIAVNEAGYDNGTVSLLIIPEILTNPEEQYAEVGDDVTLNCSADSFPAPNYQWEMMNRTSGYFEPLDDETSYVLTLESISYEEYGMYRCVATADGIEENATSTPALVTVSPLGSVDATPMNRTVSINDTANFTCRAQGGPGNMFRWVKGIFTGPTFNAPLDVDEFLDDLDNISLSYFLSFTVSGGAADGGYYTCIVVNEAGYDTDNVTLYVSPVITLNPTDQYAHPGDTVTISCMADSYPPPTYQWQVLNTDTNMYQDINGEMMTSYTIEDIDYDQFGMYRCAVTTPTINERIYSQPALITVSSNSSVTIDPDFVIAENGSNVTFNCLSRGGPNNRFIWLRPSALDSLISNNPSVSSLLNSESPIKVDDIVNQLSNITLSNEPTFTLYSINATEDGGNYACYVVNPAGVESNTTTLYVIPVITEDPREAFTNVSDTVTLTCRADSFPAPNYQWEMMNRTNGYFEPLTGQTSYVLTLESISYEEYGMYRCVATADGIEENATSTPALVTVSPRGSVDATPMYSTVSINDTANFTCRAQGGPGNMFRWIKGNFNGPTLTAPLNVSQFFNSLSIFRSGYELSFIVSGGAADGGYYTCIVVNEAGYATDNVMLFVPPVITLNPTDQYAHPGDTVTISCMADSFPPPTYQWQVLNTDTNMYQDINGETMTNFTIEEIDYDQFGMYRCAVTTPTINQRIYSQPALITVSPNSSVSIDPDLHIADNGSDITFTCSANGGPNNTFLWVRSDEFENLISLSSVLQNLPFQNTISVQDIVDELSTITLETGTTFSIYNINATEDGGEYLCIVLNEAGVDSNNTLLLVRPVITIQPQEVLTVANVSVSLNCLADSFPAPYYQWRYTPANGTSQYVPGANESTLVFPSINYEEFGSYVCIAAADGIQETATSDTAIVTVSPLGSVFITPQVNNSFEEQSVTLACGARGGPNNGFQWNYTRTGAIVGMDPDYTLNTSVETAGYYQCIVSNRAGSDDNTATVNVGPVITVNPVSINVSIEVENITLNCTARGFPVPTITWAHNDSLITSTEDEIFIYTNPTSYLRTVLSTIVINSAMANNTGDYVCIASSPFYNSVNSTVALVLVQDVPDIPVNLSTSDVTSRNLTLSWDEPHHNNAPILGYDIAYTEPDFLGRRNIELTVNGSIEMLFIDGLHPGVSYNFSVNAFNEEGDSGFSEPFTQRTLEEVPFGFPQILSSSTINSTAVNVTWMPVPPAQRNGIITGYTIFITTDVEFVNDTTQDIPSAATLQYTFTRLQEYVNYTYTILARTAIGDGPISDSTTSLTNEATPASPPQDFTVDNITSNTFTLSWSPPIERDINGVIDLYTIRYFITEQLGVDPVDPSINVRNVSATSVTLTDLGNYTEYNISVSAVTVGVGPSSSLTERTAENVPGAPPQMVTVVTVSTTSIKVNWAAPPLNMTFGIITRYEILYGEYNATTGQLINGTDPIRQVTVTSNTFMYVFNGLQEAREYGFQVRAVTVGPGPYSAIMTNTTFTAPPAAAPQNPRAPPQNDIGPTSVTLSWDPIPVDEANGDLEYSVNISADDQVSNTGNRRKRQMPPTLTNSLQQCITAAGTSNMLNYMLPGNQTSLTLTNIAPYTVYSFDVTGVTSAGRGPTSNRTTFMTPEGFATVPQVLTVVNQSNSTSLLITWYPPECYNGILDGYQIFYRAEQSDGALGNPTSPVTIPVLATTASNTTQLTQTITGLTPNTEYEVIICATNGAGCGQNETITVPTAEAAPDAVTNLALQNVRDTESVITVTWNPPSNRNGSFFYELSYTATQDFNYFTNPPRRNSTSSTIEIQQGPTNTSVIMPVLPFATYTINIYAFNAFFGRDRSSSVVTEQRRTLPTNSSSVYNLTASSQTSSSILARWDVPLLPNGNITRYDIYSNSSGTPFGSTTSLFYILNGLTTGRTYNVTVRPVTVFEQETLSGEISIMIRVVLNSTIPFDGTFVTTATAERSISSFEVNLPAPSAFGTQPLLFYGIIVANLDERPSTNQELQVQYPDPMPYSDGSDRTYYLTAGWNSGIPSTYTIGDKSTTSATRNGRRETYENVGLSRRTLYDVIVIVYLDSGVPDQPLIRYVRISQVETRLGYNEGALGFFMTLIILLIIGAIVAVVLFFVYRKYKSGIYSLVRKGRGETELESITNGKGGGGTVISNVPPEDNDVTGSKWISTSEKGYVSVGDFPAHVANMHANDDYLFSVEYPTVEPQHHPTKDATQHPDNAIKNRYANISAYDHSRVKLTEDPNVPGSDYINANYIDGYKKENAYIASQGPVPHSIVDFWRMIWEQKTETVVMLTNLEEKGRIKCHLYWPPPDKRVVVHGQIRIQLQEELSLTDYTIRTFSLQHKVSSDERTIKQYHFTSWPDFGVPEHPTTLLRFIHKVQRENPKNAGPVVVHCSAGVGRTGTFITISCQIQQILDRKCLDIYNFVQSMRYRRCFMVQTEAQYIFIHDALLEYLECGETEVSAREVKEQFRLLNEVFDKEEGKTRLEKEFDNIQETIHREPIVFTGTASPNRHKNRYANVIPFDKTRCKLSTIPGVDGSDYINANFIEGYHKGKAFIATQGPLPDTSDDFWRMVWEHKSSTIIMLANEREGGKAMCHKYWPDSGTQMYGFFEITLHSMKEYPDYILREFKIVDSRDAEGSSQHVKQFQYVSWPSKGVPDSAIGLLDVREQVEKWQRNSGDKPIVVHCSGGCGRTGTYIATCLLIDRLKTEGLVDVFQVVRGLRLQRPGMVRSVDQYEFCYKSILEFLGSFDTYANFSL
ncbi:PREDICTED: receptor-type tyrosine-protein phosphatase F-like isoform X2 [Amphimedon queenslandica]|uniref:protein-tyrosine-phosphatase n=1 Tax=Amphimedon queenslandica TaxID=400682 RepID=A0A1X7UBH9_AMPQE|nr:PREDICTED: receptor-type tyrosine-protein phosphatase F-like isoform X2 [Amphimedon queenslandica]|eukprot:XP_019855187.1 PREDICTED: receptor-type tyrosine-protein phosphatase F-like isoform X2 [Amphimedon queenslandica]